MLKNKYNNVELQDCSKDGQKNWHGMVGYQFNGNSY